MILRCIRLESLLFNILPLPFKRIYGNAKLKVYACNWSIVEFKFYNFFFIIWRIYDDALMVKFFLDIFILFQTFSLSRAVYIWYDFRCTTRMHNIFFFVIISRAKCKKCARSFPFVRNFNLSNARDCNWSLFVCGSFKCKQNKK